MARKPVKDQRSPLEIAAKNVREAVQYYLDGIADIMNKAETDHGLEVQFGVGKGPEGKWLVTNLRVTKGF